MAAPLTSCCDTPSKVTITSLLPQYTIAILMTLSSAFALTVLLVVTAAATAVARATKGVGSISTGTQCDDLDRLNITWYYNWKATPDCPVMIPKVHVVLPKLLAHWRVAILTICNAGQHWSRVCADDMERRVHQRNGHCQSNWCNSSTRLQRAQ